MGYRLKNMLSNLLTKQHVDNNEFISWLRNNIHCTDMNVFTWLMIIVYQWLDPLYYMKLVAWL